LKPADPDECHASPKSKIRTDVQQRGHRFSNRPTVAGAYREKMFTMDSMISSPLKAFLCYCAEDKPRVREPGRQLRALGVTTWLDEETTCYSRVSGRDSQGSRGSGRYNCLSLGSFHNKTGFIQKEIRLALDMADEHPPGRSLFLRASLTAMSPIASRNGSG
jgi:hypothetical protein